MSLDGVVRPADSLNFPDSPNCSFYKWSAQMFLWLNSPAPPKYGGGGGRIFNSPAFFDVSPLDSSMDRTFIAHPSGTFALRNLQMRSAQRGEHGLQVIVDKRAQMFEIDLPPLGPTGRPIILNGNGEPVEIERIVLPEGDANKTQPATRKPVFFDKNGVEIKGARPLFRPELRDANKDRLVQKFMVDKTPIFLDASGNIVETEQGQADGSVLMAQNGSLVYFVAMTNDVYAYFLTGVKDNLIAATQFPTNNAALTAIKNVAIAHGLPSPDPFPDSIALAVELKTAWVEAATVPNPVSYITVTATIPTYDTSNPLEWVPNGQKTVKMALVAMHVVGSTAGHPEMIWATFEHKNNAPNATYNYLATSGTKTVNPDFSTAYLFCAANPNVSQLNVPHMQVDPANPDNIKAMTGFTISPSNTIRGNAWGAAPNASPNPVDLTSAASNSELIKVNTDVRSMLDPADVRNNYFMTGSTWTINGGGFNGNFGNPGNAGIVTGKAVGTSQMANTTMETYQQVVPTTFSKFSNNCFSCHGSNTTHVSHIFFTPGFANHGLKPLF